MILVTGATGHLGSATIDFLLKKLPASGLAALARNEEKAAPLRAKGVDVRIGNYDDYESLVAAFAGVEKLFLISSSEVSGDRSVQHINAIKAAKAAGVKHITYTGFDVKNPGDTVLGALEGAHKTTRDFLKASGISYTILHNALYADVLPMFLGEGVMEKGVFFPAGDGVVPFTARIDMAEASAALLAGSSPLKNDYVFASDQTHSFSDVAQMLSEISGKNVAYHNPDLATYTTTMVAAGVPEKMAGFLASFGQATAAGELDTQRTDLPAILGRKPTALKDVLEAVYFSQN